MWKLAIDLGSSMTKIYRADTSNGVVLAEPSCVAVYGEDKEIKAVGKEAKNLIGKTAEYTSIVYPVYEGEIADMRLATAMLKEFLAR
ncbi:MAG: rod shape-determining protein, partial [Clostridiales bacterium]|nr:rod shape-determining protein [Clostridiales bacterium]